MRTKDEKKIKARENASDRVAIREQPRITFATQLKMAPTFYFKAIPAELRCIRLGNNFFTPVHFCSSLSAWKVL